MSERELKTEVTPEMVVEAYRATGIPVERGTMNVKGSEDRWDEKEGLIRGGEWQRNNQKAGCCAMGVLLLGKPVKGKGSEQARLLLGLDYYGFVTGFDGGIVDHATAEGGTADVHPDTRASFELGRACWAACKAANLPGTEY